MERLNEDVKILDKNKLNQIEIVNLYYFRKHWRKFIGKTKMEFTFYIEEKNMAEYSLWRFCVCHCLLTFDNTRYEWIYECNECFSLV